MVFFYLISELFRQSGAVDVINRVKTVDVDIFIPVYITNILSNRSSQSDMEEISHNTAKDTTNCYEQKVKQLQQYQQNEQSTSI